MSCAWPCGSTPNRCLHLVVGVGQHRFPLEVGVLRRSEGGVGGGSPAVRHAEQVVVEQLRRSGPVPLRPGLLVAAKLPHCPVPPLILQRRRLGLHHYQWDAVNEQDQVRNNHGLVVLSAAPLVAATYAELGGDDELVEAALRVVEVEEADDAGVPALGRVHRQGHAVSQVLVDALVAGHARGVQVFQVEDDTVGLLLRHPLVQPQQCAPQPPFQQHLPLVAALRRQGLARHVRPAQPLQQHACRLLGVVVLVQLGGGGHGKFT